MSNQINFITNESSTGSLDEQIPGKSSIYYEDTWGSANGIYVSGDYAFVTNGDGLVTVDISDPTMPEKVIFVDTPGYTYDVHVSGDYAYVACGSEGLSVIDISDPTSPALVASKNTTGTAYDIQVEGNYAYLADGTFGTPGLSIIDISNPASPGEPEKSTSSYGMGSVYVSGNYAYTGGPWMGVIDISNPASPGTVKWDDDEDFTGPQDIYVSGDYAYLASYKFQADGLRVIDISNPTNPDLIAFENTNGMPRGIHVSGDWAYIASDTSGLAIIRISDPTNPETTIYENTNGASMDVYVSGNYAYVADGSSGLAVIEISNPVDPGPPSYEDTNPGAMAIYVSGDYAYVANGPSGLAVMDISNPGNPLTPDYEDTTYSANGVYISGDYAYVADAGSGLEAINISDPTNPGTPEYENTPDGGEDVYISGDYAYVASGADGLAVMDISDPTDPGAPEYANPTGNAEGIYVEGDYAYLASGGSGLAVIDISDPTNPGLVTYADTDGYAKDSYISGDYAYVADSIGGLAVINISDPTNPGVVSTKATDGFADGIYVSGDYAYVADGPSGLAVIDISDPTNPGTPIYEDTDDYAYDVYISGDYAYVADGDSGLAIIQVRKRPWIIPPDPPSNIQGYTGLYHINLTWDAPGFDGGAPIAIYNVYRGDSPGGSKNNIGSSVLNNFTDSTVDYGIMQYYIIRAENIAGESIDSAEIPAIAAPILQWQSPAENELVVFPMGAANFSFSYSYDSLVDVKLEVNGTDFGSVWGVDSTILSPYTADIDGRVNATLHGYVEGNPNPVINDTRTFKFSKLVSEVYELLDSNTKYLGQQLYLILHDPNGDNSFSSFAESTVVSMGAGIEITSGVSGTLEIGAEFDLFGMELGASYKVEAATTAKAGYDFRYEIKDKTELTSSQDSSDKDFIGPGYGDRYWGEAQTLKYQLKAYHRTYFNGTDTYEQPKLAYGIIRGGEVLLNDYNAPQWWRNYNPVHRGWQDVDWIKQDLTIDGGSPYTKTHEVTTTTQWTQSFELEFNQEACVKLKIGGFELETTINFDWNRENYREDSETNAYETSFTINDDDSPDTIVQDWGIDRTFGTYVFRTNESMCETSYPLEHNTVDYIAPIIDFPNVELDSSYDGLYPCKDDSPIVTVDIFDEGGVQSALINFSINDGGNWDSAILSEQIANPGTWQGTIPAQNHGTTVLWHLNVWDLEGSKSIRKDPNNNDYSYIIINRAPIISLISPNGNEIFKDSVLIEWSANDPDNDALTFTLAYSDGGGGWYLIEKDLTGNSYEWNISNSLNSDSILIRIVVYDGFGGQAEDQSEFLFTIGDPPKGGSAGQLVYLPSDDDDDDDDEIDSVLITASIVIAGGVIATAIALHAFLMKKRFVAETLMLSKKKHPKKKFKSK